jgi:hypothetical protein
MKKLPGIAFSIAMLALTTTSASAATVLFSDDFDRANNKTLGNGWSELSYNRNDVAVRGKSMLLRDDAAGLPDAAAASLVIDGTGYENITVSFDWRSLGPNERKDDLFMSFAEAPAPALTDADDWTLAFNGGAGGKKWFTESISISAGADNTLFNIMFWTDVSSRLNGGKREGFRIDNVVVMGDSIVAAVPAPASLPLLAAGLLGLGFVGRRKKA